MRMRVLIRDAAMRGPPGVPHPVGAGESMFRRLFFEIGYAANFLCDLKRAVLQDRDARRIVAAIFEALQAFDYQGESFLLTNVANNAAHELEELNLPSRSQMRHCFR